MMDGAIGVGAEGDMFAQLELAATGEKRLMCAGA